MVADATKLLQAGKEPGKDGAPGPEKPALLLAFEEFRWQYPLKAGRPSAARAKGFARRSQHTRPTRPLWRAGASM